MPKYDIVPVINAGAGPATATVTPDVTMPVYKAGGMLYELQKVEIELPNGEIKTLPYDVEHGTCSYPVEPGGAYTFVVARPADKVVLGAVNARNLLDSLDR